MERVNPFMTGNRIWLVTRHLHACGIEVKVLVIDDHMIHKKINIGVEDGNNLMDNMRLDQQFKHMQIF